GAAETDVKTATGQARAQSRRVAKATGTTAKTLRSKAGDALEDASDTITDSANLVADRVDGVSQDRGYENWTRAELYDRTQELNMTGCSRMTKRELIAALRG
ncbi:MAG: hypothetical protein KDB24_13500, partial [Microthrixaceae bacterium]|nr:hypothetical protein [Microthrixaceae bacterium]